MQTPAVNSTLIDGFGRAITYLRLSVTDRCDLRCVYCMAENMTFLPRRHVCSLEELALIGEAFVRSGVSKIRLTGGEPLVRQDLPVLVEQLAQIPGLKELVLSTNGTRLSQFAQPLKTAGIQRLNISLDTLKPDRFRQLTRVGQLDDAISGIRSAKRAGFERIKINAVILKHRNSDEVLDLVRFALNEGLDISFIEEMPLGKITEHSRYEAFMPSHELRSIIQEAFTLVADDHKNITDGPSRYWQISGYPSRIGFISPHSQNFCSDCNRVRVSAEGKLHLCLGNQENADLKTLIRHSNTQDKNQLIPLLQHQLQKALTLKPEKHHFSLNDDEPQIVRFMNHTGG